MYICVYICVCVCKQQIKIQLFIILVYNEELYFHQIDVNIFNEKSQLYKNCHYVFLY